MVVDLGGPQAVPLVFQGFMHHRLITAGPPSRSPPRPPSRPLSRTPFLARTQQSRNHHTAMVPPKSLGPKKDHKEEMQTKCLVIRRKRWQRTKKRKETKEEIQSGGVDECRAAQCHCWLSPRRVVRVVVVFPIRPRSSAVASSPVDPR